jgi:hypothetical protein
MPKLICVRGIDEVSLMCGWDDCDRVGNDLIKVVIRPTRGAPGTNYVFCSEDHREYFVYSHVSYGNKRR